MAPFQGYSVHLNGKISTIEGENALEHVVFACLKDDEIRYANERLKQKEQRQKAE